MNHRSLILTTVFLNALAVVISIFIAKGAAAEGQEGQALTTSNEVQVDPLSYQSIPVLAFGKFSYFSLKHLNKLDNSQQRLERPEYLYSQNTVSSGQSPVNVISDIYSFYHIGKFAQK